MSGPTAVVDGRPVEPLGGETILAAARRLGIGIPTLCQVEGLSPEGGCRVCLVEADGAPRPLAACHTRLARGMVVRTHTPRLEALRRDVLSLYLEAHESGASATGTPGSEFEALLARHGLLPPEPAAPRPRRSVDDSHPYLRFDEALCITCRRCVAACEEIQGQFVYGIGGRGAAVHLLIGGGDRFADSGCTSCGACVELCPTGALFDRDRADGAPPERVTRSVCGYCGVGCRIEVASSGGRVLRIAGVDEAAVNGGHLCAKGRYAHAYHHASDRLREPLLRTGSGFVPIPWEEAIRRAASTLLHIRDAHGPDALAVLTSSRGTNEAAYLLQKLFRAVLGTNHVDCCARVCHSSTAAALRATTGTGAASASFADIERASCIVVAGANPIEAHPVVGARIRQAVLRGARLVVIDPRRIELAELAGAFLRCLPGTNVMLFNALAKVMVEEGLVARAYVRARAEGFAELRSFLAGLSLEEAAAVTGVEASDIAGTARLMARSRPALFVHGLGLSELTQGTASVTALVNLGILTGSIGLPGAGMLPLRGQNNVQGNADMGCQPDLLAGYQTLSDPEARARFQRMWGAFPPERSGLTVPEMFEAAAAGRIRGMWIQGEDVAQSDPNEKGVLAALRSLDFLVVQELFLSETARFAHLVLPAAGALEQDGTFTNGERRIQRVRPAVPPPGNARPDWEVVRDVANTLGARWSYAHPSEVMDEIARVAPALFGGVSYARLDTDGIQWPCPTPIHPGTASLHETTFLRGKGRLVALPFVRSPEHDVAGYPYLLVTGRVLHHYNVGTMTRRTPQRELAPLDVLEVHPEDAGREGIADGDEVELESRWGSARVRAMASDRIAPGALFLSFHFPETHTNRVVGPHVDPESHCPDYKVTAVRIRAQVPAPR